MARQLRGAADQVWRAIMFLAVCVLSGLLVAGLFLPLVSATGSAVSAATRASETIPMDFLAPPQSVRSEVRLANGETLAYFFDENRVYVPLDEISEDMKRAQLAIEDHRFYEHGALDVRATLRALVRNTADSSGTQGGSSITQQYVKMVQVAIAAANDDREGVAAAQERTIARKVQELRYAIAVEKSMTKDQILERYLNIAYYGDGAYGVEAAAQHFFDTSAKDLDIQQAAMLAGFVQNPVATNPTRYPTIALERRNVVLNRMVELGWATQEESRWAKGFGWDQARVRNFVNGCVGTRYPFLCDYVKRTVEKQPAFGATPAERFTNLKRGGFTIDTKIDERTQDAAQRAIDARLDPRDPVISVVTMIEPGTGQILAMAQNRPVMGDNAAAGETYYNYAVGGPTSDNDMGGAEGYQAGSTFKAFTAAAALEKGLGLGKSYNAAEKMNFKGQTFQSCAGPFRSPDYPVSNSTNTHGPMNMMRAMAYSVNTYFIQLERDAGICNTTRMTEKLGVELASPGSFNDYSHYPSYTLGAAEVSPLSMAVAYATFAARGKMCEPVILERMTDREGNELPVPDANCRQVLEPRVADQMNALMQNVMSGTGSRAVVPGGYPQAGKTGTIDANQAVWFMGYTPTVAASSMIAIDKTHPYWKSRSYYRSRPTLKNIRLPYSRYWMEGSGSGDVGQDIYRPAMTAALQGKPRTGFTRVSTPSRDSVEGSFGQNTRDNRTNSTNSNRSNQNSSQSSNQRGG
ncbi:transglycosylase domain-containing protein [Granulicoccus sp. GXG6511]|uniref:transglycosylase domain-containing protein n=1 Tax=Granulicoccus sp. GXG6511 TaxID=3381351 RepID=UPI003D7EFC9C